MAGYYIILDGKTVGPLSVEELGNFYQAGKINGETLYATDGAAEWLPISRLQVAPPHLPLPKIAARIGISMRIVLICCASAIIGLLCGGIFVAYLRVNRATPEEAAHKKLEFCIQTLRQNVTNIVGDIRFDIRKTDSVVSPFLGEIVYAEDSLAGEHGPRAWIGIEHRLTLAYQTDKWLLKANANRDSASPGLLRLDARMSAEQGKARTFDEEWKDAGYWDSIEEERRIGLR